MCRTNLSDPALGTVPWWLAWGALLVNDHILKGAGWLPGWVTGKVSDLAFLVVAPPLVTTLLRAGAEPRRRAAVWSVVVLGFAVINLVPAAAAGVVDLAGLGGLTWRLTVDPTDLVALAVVPGAWRLGSRPLEGPCASLPSRPGNRHRARREVPASTRRAVALASVACLASPGPEEPDAFFDASAALTNETEDTVDVRVRWPRGAVACASDHLRRNLVGAFTMEAFGPGRTFVVAPGESLPLDPPDDPIGGACVALVAAPGLSPHVVAFEPQPRALFVGTDPADAFIPAVRLRGGAAFRELVGDAETIGDGRLGVAPLAAGAPRCGARGLPTSWPTAAPQVERRPETGADGVVTEVDALGEGCFRLGLEASTLATASEETTADLDFCIPDALALPFTAGMPIRVEVSAGTRSPSPVGLSRVFAVTTVPSLESLEPGETSVQLTVIRSFLHPVPLGGGSQADLWPRGEAGIGTPFAVAVDRPGDDCRGETTLCGARVRPLVGELLLAGEVESVPLIPGGPAVALDHEVAIPGASWQVESTFALARAEDVIFTPVGGCVDGREATGPVVEVVSVSKFTRHPGDDPMEEDEEPR